MKKVAFCFLTYGDVEQQKLWSEFFKDADPAQYVNILHRADGDRSTWLPNCTVIPTRKTEYAKFSLVEAQQDMFNAAFRDPDVVKFVMLSGDTIPLHPFRRVYEQLIKDDMGYITSHGCNDMKVKQGLTVNKAAWPMDKPWAWQLSHQWIVLNRMHIQMLNDNWPMLTAVFGPSQIPDEHMYLVFFTGFGCMDTFHKALVMRINWTQPSPAQCSLTHRRLPRAHHTTDFTQACVNWLYSVDNHLFLRKVCKTAEITMDWTAEKPIVPVASSGNESIKQFKYTGGPKGRAFFFRNI